MLQRAKDMKPWNYQKHMYVRKYTLRQNRKHVSRPMHRSH